MKKIFILLLVVLFAGCALAPVKHEPQTSEYQVSPDALEELLKLLEETGANKIRAFTGKTGGTSGMLDSISVSSLANNDLAIVFDVSTMYYYKFNSSATDAENDPDYIRPDDYSSSGVWYLLSGFTFARSATPQWNFRDSGCTDYDDNVRIYANCTDVDSTEEDCDITIAVQIAGTLTDVLTIDADGLITGNELPMNARFDVTDDTDDNNISKAELNAMILDQDGDTWVLPDIDASDGLGWSVCIYGDSASAITVDPDNEDIIIDTFDDGGAESAGEAFTSGGSAGDMICLVVVKFSTDIAYWAITSENGTWSPAD